MAYGDIHNHNGTVCQASKKPCPLGENGHSSSVDEYVYHHADETGVDPTVIKRAISDGAKPAEAVQLAKEGLLEDYAPTSTEPRRGGYLAGEDRFRFRKDMTPQDLRQITWELDRKFKTKLNGSKAVAPIHLRLSDSNGGGLGTPSVSYDPTTEKYSVGAHRYRSYNPEFESNSLRSVVDKASELYGYEDAEREVVDAW